MGFFFFFEVQLDFFVYFLGLHKKSCCQNRPTLYDVHLMGFFSTSQARDVDTLIIICS